MLCHKYLVSRLFFLSPSGGRQKLIKEHVVLLQVLLDYALLHFLIISLDLVFSPDPTAHQFVLLVCQVRMAFDDFQLIGQKLIDVLFHVLLGQLRQNPQEPFEAQIALPFWAFSDDGSDAFRKVALLALHEK